MIITAKTHPTLLKDFGSFRSIDRDGDIRLLNNYDDMFFYHEAEQKTPSYILPYLFFSSLRQEQTHDYCIELLAQLKAQKMDALLESIITYGLIREVEVSEMQVLMPYIKLNETFKFDKYSAHHFYMGLTPLMLAKEHKTVDLFLSQPEIDLNIKANPMQYWAQFEAFLTEKNGTYERIKTKKDFLKIEGKNALEFSILYKQKYKKGKFLSLANPQEKADDDQKRFDAIINEPKLHIKKTQFIKELFVNNQFLLAHLEDVRLKEVLTYQNNKQNNALFHAIKEGKKESVKKLVKLGYFKGSDKNTSKEGYLEYAYRYGQTTLVLELFNHQLYCENEEQLKKLICQKLDKNLYEAFFFKNPKKEDLGFAIKLGSSDVMEYLLNTSFYTLEEKKKVFNDYMLFFLTNQTKSDNASLKYIEMDNGGAQKVYFQLMKHLMKVDKAHLNEYGATFLETFKEQYLINKTKRYPVLDKEQMAAMLNRMIKIIPSMKKEAIDVFLGLDPLNTRLMSTEKQVMSKMIAKPEVKITSKKLKI